MKFRSLKQEFEPYMDVIIFMVTLLVVNYTWKYTMTGDENGERVTWFGLDLTAPFEYMACHIAAAVYWLTSLVREGVSLVNEHTIRYANGIGTTIIWGCSGLKQMFIWMCLLLTVRSLSKADRRRVWLHKLWFIPVGWLCCYAFNILRIFLITLAIEHHPDWFYFLHDILFKYLFYGMLFGLWLLFVEKIRGPYVEPAQSAEE